MNTNTLPTTIHEYLEQLRTALRGADPAMIQDAVYDAEAASGDAGAFTSSIEVVTKDYRRVG